jgi:hypothetical protein
MRKLAVTGFLALSACATPAPRDREMKERVVLYSTPGSPKPEGKVVCSVDRPTGSNIAERICRYENQADWAAERTQDALLEMQRRPCTGKAVCTAQ